ncbi:MAG: hypothetical protein HQ567_02900 [Candidatus Nealsonbacteria bacterium]|nr:hypothetical protein [Candidatus Nealsonbacteria bacterium]
MLRTSMFVAVVAAVALSALTAVAQPGRGLPILGGRGPAATVAKPWNEAELVFTGKLNGVDAGPVGQSFPPMYTHTLHFTVEKVLRGTLKPGAKVDCSHVARQHNRPAFPVGKVCLVAAGKARGGTRAEIVVEATAEKLAEVTLACSMPMGWKLDAGKPVSPWAALDAKGWSGAGGSGSQIFCSKTGRPALMAGGDVTFKVEKVPPEKDIKWTNPDGDGEYKITVTNATDKPIAVPALLSDGDKILWQESLAILCQGKAYVCPGSQGVSQQVQPTKLQPGQSVSTVVNALRLKGPEWPRGGYRIEFRFCLGEKSRTMSFYYMSRHHDKIRSALAKESQ